MPRGIGGIVCSCIGIALLWSVPAWAAGEADSAPSLEDTVRTMSERIKELENEMRQLKSMSAPPAHTPAHAPAPEPAHGSGHVSHGVADPTLSPVERRLGALEDGLSLLKGIEFGGMLYSAYEYNFNRPESDENSLRIFDREHNNFTLDLFQLSVGRESAHGVGFKTVLDFGKTASSIASDWDGDGSLESAEETNEFEVQEAYLTYTVPVGKGLEVKAGKFVTLLGAEVIEAPYNYNASRSFLFGFAIPFTHTGVLLSYPLHDMLRLTAGVVNGWDNVVDSNDGKTFLGSLSFAPTDSLSWSFNGVYGTEQADRGDSKRGVFDTVLSYTPMEHVDMVFNYDYGTESNILGAVESESGEGSRKFRGTGNAVWQGVSGILSLGGALVHHDLEPFSLAVRGEWFSDEDLTRLAIEETARELIRGGADVWEVTTTLKWELGHHAEVRLEYRHDEASEQIFERSEGFFSSGQDTLAAEFALVF